jgi:hypothetical protein
LKIYVTLQFASLEKLWAYKSRINLTTFEISAGSKTLTFEATDAQIELAETAYSALVVYSDLESKIA